MGKVQNKSRRIGELLGGFFNVVGVSFRSDSRSQKNLMKVYTTHCVS